MPAGTISLSACSRVIIFLFFPVKAVSPGDGPGALSRRFELRFGSPDDDFWPGIRIVWGDVAKPSVFLLPGGFAV